MSALSILKEKRIEAKKNIKNTVKINNNQIQIPIVVHSERRPIILPFFIDFFLFVGRCKTFPFIHAQIYILMLIQFA